MRPRYHPPSSSGRGERGAVALLLVIGVMAVLLLLGAVAANAARQELRLSRVGANAEQIAILVEAGFNWAAKKAELDAAWPVVGFDGGAACYARSDPNWGATLPRFCVDAIVQRGVGGPPYRSVPIRVAYQVHPNDPIQFAYGWILIETRGARRIISLVPNRAWCDPNPNYLEGPCLLGG